MNNGKGRHKFAIIEREGPWREEDADRNRPLVAAYCIDDKGQEVLKGAPDAREIEHAKVAEKFIECIWNYTT